MKRNNPELSIVVLNYNTRDLLQNCLDSLSKLQDEVNFEVVVVDNGSNDGSSEMVKKEFPWATLIRNKTNLGFAKGNNRAKSYVKAKYVLILNSDTEVKKNVLKKSIEYMETHLDVGAVTCKIVLPDGTLDKDARRSFPTPWVSLTHFSYLDRIFPKSKIFAKYWYGYKSADEIQEIEVLQGAYLLARKEVLDSVGWFSEEYFLDGEDIDLCWRIKEKGWKIVYYPTVSVLHLKGATKGKIKHSFGKVTRQERLRFVMSGVDSMEIFYRKRLWNKYPLALNLLVIFGVRLLKFFRSVRAFLR